jgi:hypothetical protein
MATFSLSNNPTTSVMFFWSLGSICQWVNELMISDYVYCTIPDHYFRIFGLLSWPLYQILEVVLVLWSVGIGIVVVIVIRWYSFGDFLGRGLGMITRGKQRNISEDWPFSEIQIWGSVSRCLVSREISTVASWIVAQINKTWKWTLISGCSSISMSESSNRKR